MLHVEQHVVVVARSRKEIIRVECERTETRRQLENVRLEQSELIVGFELQRVD